MPKYKLMPKGDGSIKVLLCCEHREQHRVAIMQRSDDPIPFVETMPKECFTCTDSFMCSQELTISQIKAIWQNDKKWAILNLENGRWNHLVAVAIIKGLILESDINKRVNRCGDIN
jgi:hypothetical protein